MKNKNGFIATSLILTFFLLFCALLISTVSNYNFNQNLIDKLKDIDINTETVPNGWNNAEEGTLLAGIKANYKEPSVPLTTPGKEISLSNEALMAATLDDYGMSFYFRGNVQNNYVAFAGMCWRIVRVTGDGSIKLVLYNYSSDDCTETADDLAFARYNGTKYTTTFNTDYTDNTYLGFMYGTPGASTYAETHANINKSTILKNLETWYINNIASYEEKLADVIWCNDKSTNSGTGIGTASTKYGLFGRETHPNLICQNDKNGGKLSKFTVADTTYGNGDLDYKIGLLTVDEILFSGLNNDTYNNNYLTENALKLWWSLSPYQLSGGWLFIYGVNNIGEETSFIASAGNVGLRPAIALKSNTTISSGNGTASNPFVIS